MKEIRTEIIINASAEKTWKVLIDFNNYSQWNPFIRQIIGEPKVGSKLHMNLLTSGGKTRSYSPTVTKVEPFYELRWLGKSFIPGIFDGERIFIIEPIKTDQVKFVHIEIFKGLGVSLAGSRLDKDVHKGFEKMNNAFKEKVELKDNK